MAPVAFDDTKRLISGRYTEDAEHALADLSDTDDELTALIQLSAATNSRLQAQAERHPGGLGREDVVFGVQFSRIVNAAFTYPGEGGRFHRPGGRGAWYCALDINTCLAEVAYHRIRMLREVDLTDEADIPFRLFLADIHAQDFAWLDDAGQATQECLVPTSYAAGQLLGTSLRAAAAGGVVYPSVRRSTGTNLAVFAPSIVANVRREALYLLAIEGTKLSRADRVA